MGEKQNGADNRKREEYYRKEKKKAMIATRNERNERYKETTNNDNNYDRTKTAKQMKGEYKRAMTSDGFPNEESKKSEGKRKVNN